MAWMSRTLSSSLVKSVTSFSRACAASRAFSACWLNRTKKMPLRGIRLSRMSPPLRVGPRESLRDLAVDGPHRGAGHEDREGGEDADVAQDERVGEGVALDHHRAKGLVRVRERHHRRERTEYIVQLVH